jgi:uncharacterized delta-60 repeat protein
MAANCKDIYDIAFQDDERVIVIGCFQTYRGQTVNRIVRLNCFGDIDPNFLGGTRFLSVSSFYGPEVIKIKENTNINPFLSDNSRIICGGIFSEYNGQPRGGIVRLLRNGNIDTAITYGTGFLFVGGSPSVKTIDLNSGDVKMAVGGQFGVYNGTNCNSICVMDYSTGNIDTTFVRGTNFGFNLGSIVYGLSYQSDNRLIAVGNFNQYTCNNITTSVNQIVRLNTDGTIDNTFNIGGTGPNGTSISKVEIQTDGRIIVTGAFTTFNGFNRRGVVRLNTDGSVDTTFDVGTGFDTTVKKILIQTDGKIIFTGSFQSFNGISAPSIIRLNTDGTKDTGYNYGNGFFNASSSSFNIVGTLNSQNILVAGQSNTLYYNNTPIVSLAKINTNGQIQCPDFQLKCCAPAGGNSSFYRVRNCSDLGAGWAEFPNGCT